jgi:hypothetical protein
MKDYVSIGGTKHTTLHAAVLASQQVVMADAVAQILDRQIRAASLVTYTKACFGIHYVLQQ